ncbi:MAG: ABC transporter ATP-binding protein [Fusobacteriaceae bacterium]
MLELKNICYSIEGKEIIKNVTFTFEKGKIYGLLGPNGSGKSTMLDIIVGHREDYEGEISIDEKDLRKVRGKELGKNLALVPQDFDTHFNYSAREILEMGRYPYDTFLTQDRRDDEIIERYVELFSLEKLLEKDIYSMSGGERQRIIFAKAMIQESGYILLDEATSNMDIHYAHALFRNLREVVKKEKRGAVAVIHDMNLASQYCDEIIMLKDGEVKFSGSPEKVLISENIDKIFRVKSKIFEIDGERVILTHI